MFDLVGSRSDQNNRELPTPDDWKWAGLKAIIMANSR